METIKRQLIAGCLLLVFSFIIAAKLFHSHETITTTNVSSHIEGVEKSSDCAVCDFHFSKDADAAYQYVFEPVLPFNSTFLVSFQSEDASSIGLSYADRGPPATV